MTQAPVQPKPHPQTSWAAEQILEELTQLLPTATTELQQQALAALKSGKYSQCKIYPCLNLDDPFIKGIGYMSSIPTVIAKGVPTLPTLMGESCRAIVDACYLAAQEKKGAEEAVKVRDTTKAALEQINTQIFEKGLI